MNAPAPSALTGRRFEVRYRIQAATQAVAEEAAAAIALEQSVEVPLEAVFDAGVRENIVGRVVSVVPEGEGTFVARVALATDTTGDDVAQTLNMLFGNSSMHAHAQLLDADLPESLVAACGGPRFGIDGMRRLTGAHGRPLTCAALKPQGLPVEELARLCYIFAAAGIDVIKDDHGISDQFYSPFAARVPACQAAIRRAARETGRTALYAPSLVGSPKALYAQANLLREEGVGAALVAPGLVGIPVFHELVADHLKVPVLAHPSYSGSVRVAPAFIYGKLFRLLGADAVIYTHYAGRFAYSQAECESIAAAARAPWPGVKPCLPVPAGGMTVERAGELVRFCGIDSMLLIGGSLLRAGAALPERTRQFVQAVADSAAAMPQGAAA
ncbi:MAG: ribulose 1,5-bisphosphate carboxylase [Proteobacteria bacterium]|nr:ribulose 1,5-bisphosphate carboxylase [Pseudomonadota bacterium]